MGHDQDLIYLVSEWKWYVKFIFYPDFVFFSAFSTKQFIFLPRSRFFSVFSGKQFIFLLSFYLDLGFFKLSQANCSSSYLDLGFVQLSRCFSLTFHISTYFCFIFVFIFFSRWMKWVEDRSRPIFDLFGFRMKVVCKVHILSRFHFFQLSQPNSSSFYPDLIFFSFFDVFH